MKEILNNNIVWSLYNRATTHHHYHSLIITYIGTHADILINMSNYTLTDVEVPARPPVCHGDKMAARQRPTRSSATHNELAADVGFTPAVSASASPLGEQARQVCQHELLTEVCDSSLTREISQRAARTRLGGWRRHRVLQGRLQCLMLLMMCESRHGHRDYLDCLVDDEKMPSMFWLMT